MSYDEGNKSTGPKATRFPIERFRSKADYDLFEMACDQIDAGVNLDFYLAKSNNGFVKMTDGNFKQYFMR